MSDTPYSIRREAALQYSFFSEGPKGRIEKLVRYDQMGKYLFNLSFGDRIEGTDDIDVKVVTNNQDGYKVIATVISTLEIFFEQFPLAKVFIMGSTPSRIKTYRRMVKTQGEKYKDKYEFFGGKGELYEPFQEGVDYNFILIKKRKA